MALVTSTGPNRGKAATHEAPKKILRRSRADSRRPAREIASLMRRVRPWTCEAISVRRSSDEPPDLDFGEVIARE